ncbi:MAG: P-loop NTPase fold protein [Actinomycetota bacterium]|nr:P-loop NTPase fold protein [Actinomycetota bacterium]
MAAWDQSTPLRIGPAHAGPISAVATARLDDGRTLIISGGGGDGVLRRWDAASGQPVGEPLRGHPGLVWALACARLDDGRTLIISGSEDWSLILWPLRPNGQIADEPIPTPRVRALSVVDDETVGDALNRGVLAAHLEGLLIQLTTKQRAGTAVVHIDGRWGAGKSTLVNLLVERLGSPPQPPDAPAPEEPAKQWLTDPMLVLYDAWRESTVAPEWWSLARSINMAVRSQRAFATRAAMTVTGAVTRTARSRPVLVAAAVLVTMLVAWASGAWQGDVGAVGKVLTTAVTVATLGLALGRVLFWASPAFGRLHQRAGDNPLGEIAATVASLRRWSPRGIRGHRVADTLFALSVGATVTGYLLAVLWEPTIRSGALAELRGIGAHVLGLAAAAIAALLVVGCWQRAPASRRTPEHGFEPEELTSQPRRASPRSRIVARWLRVVLLAVAVAGAYVAFSPGLATQWLPPLPMIQRHPGGWAVGVVLGCTVLYALWTASRRRQPRRPILLVIDDLDRCSAERVVKLMETVHTVLREPAETRLLRVWRRPATLIALVLADGRWVRTAFETSYESFGALGSPTHGLGADFLQKVFDHTVLVPELAADQVQTYVDHVTGTSAWAIRGRTTVDAEVDQGPTRMSTPALSIPGQSVADTDGQAPPPDGLVGEPPPDAAAAAMPDPAPAATDPVPAETAPAPAGSATQRAERLIDEAAPGEVHSQSIRAALDDTPGQDRGWLAEAIATKAATTEALAAFTEDLLTRYTPLMPANPRLIKRVANAFGMLLALGLHLGHHEDEDTLARAAILLVRFPTLVDDLLSAPDPPMLDPPADSSPTDRPSPWLHRDVQQVLRRPDGSRVDITHIARCYGRCYAPDLASPPGAPTRPGTPSESDQLPHKIAAN